jgi:hypothetical protein
MPRVRVAISLPFYLRATLHDGVEPSAAISALESLVGVQAELESVIPPALHITAKKHAYLDYFDTPSGVPRVPEGFECYVKAIARVRQR